MAYKKVHINAPASGGGGGEGGSIDVINNLNSSRTDAALSAKQGSVLNENLVQLEAEVNQLGGTVAGKRTALTPLFENAGAVFNDSTGYYELNGLTDITESEMMDIYSVSSNWVGGTFEKKFANTTVRTILRSKVDYVFSNAVSFQNCFYYSKMEIIDLRVVGKNSVDNSLIGIGSRMFFSCTKLHTILGEVTVQYLDNASKIDGMFLNCTMLKNVSVRRLKFSISFKDSPRLSKESILYMIQNSEATSAITITLQSTAYAMAIADPDIQAALASKTFVSLASA